MDLNSSEIPYLYKIFQVQRTDMIDNYYHLHVELIKSRILKYIEKIST